MSIKNKNKDITYGNADVDFPDSLNNREVKVRITAMIDGDVKSKLQRRAKEENTKYQTLLNQILRQHLFDEKNPIEKRLEKIEGELSQLKEKIA